VELRWREPDHGRLGVADGAADTQLHTEGREMWRLPTVEPGRLCVEGVHLVGRRKPPSLGEAVAETIRGHGTCWRRGCVG